VKVYLNYRDAFFTWDGRFY